MTEYLFPQDLKDDVTSDTFTFLNDELMPDDADAGYTRPSFSFVRVDFDQLGQGGARYEAAVREYARIEEALRAEAAVRRELKMYFTLPGLDRAAELKVYDWRGRRAYFVLPEAQQAEFEEWNTSEFSAFCAEKNIHFVVKKGDRFHDLTTGEDFVIHCEYFPGMADDAATYQEYTILKVEQK